MEKDFLHNCATFSSHDDEPDNQDEYTSRYFQNATEENSKSSSFTICSGDVTTTADSSQDLSQQSISSETDELSLSQLTLEEQLPIKISPFYNITPREMPVSPHYVFEEEFSQNPWAMLIATVFLTKTSGKTARPYLKNFFELYPTPYDVLNVNPETLKHFFVNLGLKKRAYMIWKLSYQFVSSKWMRASDLCGIGKYGEDAYRIFCLGHTNLDPGDRYLKLYLDWLTSHSEFLEDMGVEESNCCLEDPVSQYYEISLREPS